MFPRSRIQTLDTANGRELFASLARLRLRRGGLGCLLSRFRLVGLLQVLVDELHLFAPLGIALFFSSGAVAAFVMHARRLLSYFPAAHSVLHVASSTPPTFAACAHASSHRFLHDGSARAASSKPRVSARIRRAYRCSRGPTTVSAAPERAAPAARSAPQGRGGQDTGAKGASSGAGALGGPQTPLWPRLPLFLLTIHPPTPSVVLPGGTAPEHPRRRLALLGAGSRSLAVQILLTNVQLAVTYY